MDVCVFSPAFFIEAHEGRNEKTISEPICSITNDQRMRISRSKNCSGNCNKLSPQRSLGDNSNCAKNALKQWSACASQLCANKWMAFMLTWTVHVSEYFLNCRTQERAGRGRWRRLLYRRWARRLQIGCTDLWRVSLCVVRIRNHVRRRMPLLMQMLNIWKTTENNSLLRMITLHNNTTTGRLRMCCRTCARNFHNQLTNGTRNFNCDSLDALWSHVHMEIGWKSESVSNVLDSNRFNEMDENFPNYLYRYN